MVQDVGALFPVNTLSTVPSGSRLSTDLESDYAASQTGTRDQRAGSSRDGSVRYRYFNRVGRSIVD